MIPQLFSEINSKAQKKSSKLRPQWRGYSTLPQESTSISRQTLRAKIRSEYISRIAMFSVVESLNEAATLVMYLLPNFAQKVCLDKQLDSQGSVGYPLHYGLNLDRFFWALELISEKTSGTLCFSQHFTQGSALKLQIPDTCKSVIQSEWMLSKIMHFYRAKGNKISVC